MFYYNLRYHFKTKPGSPESGCGSIVLASAVAAEEMSRRQFKNYPHLQHRIFDPQLYLAGLDPRTAEGTVRKLSSYKWFGGQSVPEYDSSKHGSMKTYRATYGEQLLEGWSRSLPKDLSSIGQAARAAVEFQLNLGCEAILLPSPMTDTHRSGYQEEVQWLDAGLEASRELRVSLPVYATVALTSNVLRGTSPLREGLLNAVSGHVASRERLAGAYIVIEQGDEQKVDCTSGDTLASLLLLIDDLVRGAGRQVIVNYMGTFGAIATAAGASIWATGYYPSQRRLRFADFDDKEAFAYPRYFSVRLLGDVGIRDDLLTLCKRNLSSRILTDTTSARSLHAALRRGEAPDSLPLWEYKQGNHSLAMPHYYECMYTFGRHLHSMERTERVEFVDKWLASAAALAAELRAVKPKLSGRTELSHQETWLTEFRKWRGYAES